MKLELDRRNQKRLAREEFRNSREEFFQEVYEENGSYKICVGLVM